jgi:hypothetical protein
MSTAVHRSQNKLWRSNSIFDRSTALHSHLPSNVCQLITHSAMVTFREDNLSLDNFPCNFSLRFPTHSSFHRMSPSPFFAVLGMEEPGEQCTVVFALIVTELASTCVGVSSTPPPPPNRFRNSLCKDDSALFSSVGFDSERGCRSWSGSTRSWRAWRST